MLLRWVRGSIGCRRRARRRGWPVLDSVIDDGPEDQIAKGCDGDEIDGEGEDRETCSDV